MATVEQVKKALVAVEELCGKCPVYDRENQ